MSNPQRPFALQPRRFPLPTLPFRSDLDGFGVGTKIRLEATPYNGCPSGFEVCLSESTSDVALFARVSFDSEGRSAIEVKSRLDGKWSPPVRHIAIGLVLDRTFVLDIIVDSSEFVLKVDGFKIATFVKRSDDVRSFMMSGALVVNEIVITPSLLHYQPPPEYNELDPAFDVNFALQKLALMPTAPDMTLSNTLFQKQPLSGSRLEPIPDDSIVLGGFRGYRGDSGSSHSSIGQPAPPRPPPPTSRELSATSTSPKRRGAIRNCAQYQGPLPTGHLLMKKPTPQSSAYLQRSYSQTSYLYPNIHEEYNDQLASSTNATARQAAMANASKSATHQSNSTSNLIAQPAQERRPHRRAEGGARETQMQNLDVPRRSPRERRSSPQADSQPNHPRNDASSDATHSTLLRARSRSFANGTVDTALKMRTRRNLEPHKKQARPLTTLTTSGIYSPLFSTKQLQEKTESMCRATKNFFKVNLRSNLAKNMRSPKQLIRTALTEGNVLTIIAIPVANFNKFDVGFMRGEDYAMLFSARHNEKCIVLNSTRGGIWQKEERVHRFPFMDEESFTLNIRIGNPLQVHINGNFFCGFNLRSGLPIDAVKLDNNLRLEQFRTNQ